MREKPPINDISREVGPEIAYDRGAAGTDRESQLVCHRHLFIH